jgi:cytochrome bd-type quinol oxidase subunit 2
MDKTDMLWGFVFGTGFFFLFVALWLKVKRDGKRELEEYKARLSYPWPSKGVLWWAGFIVFGVLNGLYHQQYWNYASILALLGGIISVAVCVWWFDLSKRRRRRSLLSRGSGYIAFGWGSMLPASLYVIPDELFVKNGNVTGLIMFFWFLVIVAAGLVAGASYLVFRKDEKGGLRQRDQHDGGTAANSEVAEAGKK